MATARLRKTFHYPEEEDSDEPVDGIDEEEQEKLITQLHAQDAAKTALYQKIFLALPLLSTLIYLPTLLRPTTSSTFLSSILNVSSLLSTAYILYRVPYSRSSHSDGVAGASRYAGHDYLEPGPLEKYIVYANAGLCGVLALRAWLLGGGAGRETEWLGVLPGLVFALIMVVRTQLRPVDVAELERLRYEYKGA